MLDKFHHICIAWSRDSTYFDDVELNSVADKFQVFNRPGVAGAVL